VLLLAARGRAMGNQLVVGKFDKQAFFQSMRVRWICIR
jgi:hypothetical protein